MNYSNKNMKSNFYLLTFLLIIFFTINGYAAERKKYNFNSEWRLQVGDFPQAKKPDFKDSSWKQVTLPQPSTKMRLSEYPSNSIPIRLSGIASISG